MKFVNPAQNGTTVLCEGFRKYLCGNLEYGQSADMCACNAHAKGYKTAPMNLTFHRGCVRFLADHERRDLLHEILAVIGVDFQGNGLGQVQGEDAQDGLAVYHVAADAQVDVVGVAVDNVDKGLDILSQAELDIYSFHGSISPHIQSVLNT